MRKKSYVKPDLICEEFTPEAYCASCKDQGVTTYSASCDTSGYVFLDDGDGVFENGIDEYLYYNSAGEDCNFTINYYPGKKNAFIFTESSYVEDISTFLNKNYKVKEGYENKAIYGYHIIEKGGGFLGSDNHHFIANLNSNTISPNLS